MRGYPQLSFWILITLAKICFFHIILNCTKNIVVLVGKSLKKPEYPEMHRRYAQQQKEAPSLSLSVRSLHSNSNKPVKGHRAPTEMQLNTPKNDNYERRQLSREKKKNYFSKKQL